MDGAHQKILKSKRHLHTYEMPEQDENGEPTEASVQVIRQTTASLS